ncbi:MAG TPA: hypothetical protein VMR65_09175 [Candidatus Sulfotelmatobacter sp.]|jgi:hypothetical protein|nr:hypothetical protein [Candidatus Sulfotelmatobacter sp.]
MTFLLLLPPALSYLLLAAHFYRLGRYGAVAAMLILTGLLAMRRRFVVRLTQITLVLGSVVWLHTLYVIRGVRILEGRPVGRLTAILLAISAFTLVSPLVLLAPRLRARFGAGGDAPNS